jgi:putative CocE/NonD family hydrolase
MTPHRAAKTGPSDTDESTDTFDTIEWLLKNVANHNGRVGQFGISYPGFYASAGMIDAHPALKAVSPQAPIADWYFDDFYHHGALFLPHCFNFFSGFGKAREGPTTEGKPGIRHPTPDGYQFFLDLGPLKNVNEKYYKGEIAFWNEVVEHPAYDEFWQSRNILPHLKKVAPAVMTVGGWFDAEDLYGALNTYRAVEEQRTATRWATSTSAPRPATSTASTSSCRSSITSSRARARCRCRRRTSSRPGRICGAPSTTGRPTG